MATDISCTSTSVRRGATLAIVSYVLAYFAGSGADLWTTELALRAGGSEANIYATDAGTYIAAKAWMITLVGGITMTALFAFGAAHAGRVSAHWLERPMHSFLAAFYFIPWSGRVMDRSPLHCVSYAIAFVLLRFLAAANNLFIVIGMPPPIGSLIRSAAQHMPFGIAFGLVVGALYVGLTVIIAPIGAKLIGCGRAIAARLP